MPTLHIFRGLPGSGKSTAARKLAEETGAILIEPDALLVQDGEYWYTPSNYAIAYELTLSIVHIASRSSGDIIFADVLPRRNNVKYVISKLHPVWAVSYRWEVHDLKITAEESKLRNRHNVRPKDIDRMAAEWEDWE